MRSSTHRKLANSIDSSYEKLADMSTSSGASKSSSSTHGALGSMHAKPPLVVSPQVYSGVLTQVQSQQSPPSKSGAGEIRHESNILRGYYVTAFGTAVAYQVHPSQRKNAG